MANLLQWKVSYCRSDGSTGLVYIGLPNERMGSDLMDRILQWDTDHQYLKVDARNAANQLVQATAFFELMVFHRSMRDRWMTISMRPRTSNIPPRITAPGRFGPPGAKRTAH